MVEIKHRVSGKVLLSRDVDTLRNEKLAGSQLPFADFSGMDLTNCDLRSSDLREANFSGAYIGPDPNYYMTYVSNGNFTDANFTGADISRMEFYSNCTHYQANFHGANLLTVVFRSFYFS